MRFVKPCCCAKTAKSLRPEAHGLCVQTVNTHFCRPWSNVHRRQHPSHFGSRLVLFLMSWFEIISVGILGGLFLLWLDSTRVHEIALEHAGRQCQVHEVQFLDGTVSLENIEPARDEDGRLRSTFTEGRRFSSANLSPALLLCNGLLPPRAAAHPIGCPTHWLQLAVSLHSEWRCGWPAGPS